MAERSLVVRIIGDSSSLQRSFAQSSRATKQFDRDFSRATRGVLAGSGVFRSLGRSLAFASGGFLAFGGAASFLRKSVDAAKEAQVANAQLATQLQNSGKMFADYRDEIDRTVARLSALAGIEDDELKAGLTTILRTVPDVSKALRDLGTAADLARARHISLGAAATIIAKTEAGNTTLLRRQGFQIAKNATAEQALARVRRVVAGQAAAGTTEQERFGAVLHQTEEIIGTALLPTLNKYLTSGTKWLEQMNESGKLQKDVQKAAEGFAGAMSTLASAVKTVDRFTGGFRHTLELLIGLNLAKRLVVWADGMGLFATRERAATARAAELRVALAKLAAIGVITIGVEVLLNKKSIDKSVTDFLRSNHLGFLTGTKIKLGADVDATDIEVAIQKLQKLGGQGLLIEALRKVQARMDAVSGSANQMGESVALAGAKAAHGLNLAAQAAANADTAISGLNLTAEQKNTFFDNAIARLLLRGGLGDINQQIAALETADRRIAARIKVTKDVTRKLNLEDELLQNQARISDLRAQQTSDATQKTADAAQKRQDALQEFIASLQLGVTRAQVTSTLNDDIKALQALEAGIRSEIAETGRTADLAGQLFDVQQQLKDARQRQASAAEFFTLGLGPTGEERIPTKANLKKRLGTLSEAVQGTFLDTNATRKQLAAIRKVLSESIVPTDVRSKIKEMFDEIRDQLNKGLGSGNVTRFAHANTLKLLSGLGLTPDLKRELERRIAQIGVGGSIPGVTSPAFASAGASNPVVVNTTLLLDGKKVAQNTTTHQRRQNQRRADARRGPYAGRH